MGAASCCHGTSGLSMSIRLSIRICMLCPWGPAVEVQDSGQNVKRVSDPSKQFKGHAATTQMSEERVKSGNQRVSISTPVTVYLQATGNILWQSDFQNMPMDYLLWRKVLFKDASESARSLKHDLHRTVVFS